MSELIMSIEIYQKYLEARSTSIFNGKFMEYDWEGFPELVGGEWLIYSQMLTEFSREISNVINDLTNYTFWLDCWDQVLAGVGDDEKMSILHDYVNPLAITALNLPYAIRSRLIFGNAHLSHQANRFIDGEEWKDDLPLDDAIYFSVADKYCSKWFSYTKLKLALEKIDNKEYKEKTDDFRNKYNHRFSRRIELGISGLVNRHVSTTGEVSYSLSAVSPLKLGEIVETLEKQCQHCYKAFNRFQKLIHEQIALAK
ncbi:hypothetical protein [Methyloradius palustris]|uniref:Uncharacterized protein n=1 Tax=Methyloradius palustris TaxID=2778876 RepID=A0A8D5GC57_9PROT|nr:hypothetical protein [Methyloradius palustris]BCM23829.1 hypothetical protein ZMTM_00880 [Methyloradius palustris]